MHEQTACVAQFTGYHQRASGLTLITFRLDTYYMTTLTMAPETKPLPADADKLYDLQQTSFQIGQHTVHVEYGRMARLANAAITLRIEDTMIMVTATGSKEPRAGIDFFPLLCDFEEKMYAVGRIPGGFIKREGRPSEKAVLTCRLMDRPIRPLWPDGYKNDVQVVSMPLSSDEKHQLDVLSVLGASFALELSELPFQGPLGCVRIGRNEAGEFILNPTFEESDASDLDLIVAGTKDSIMMVEAGAQFVSEDLLTAALEVAHEAIKEQCAVQEAFRAQCGKTKPEFVNPDQADQDALDAFLAEQAEANVTKAYHIADRDERKALLDETKEAAKAALEALPEDHSLRQFVDNHVIAQFPAAYKRLEKRIMRTMVINEGVRADGRKTDEIRPIACEVGVVPRVHGSALFTRGQTQVLSICTLGAPGDKQSLDGIDPLKEKRWMHHYNFPPYSVGEVRPLRGAGRREIGHGALASRAVEASLPTKEDWPYTMRVNSEVISSNGSTSMGSTCGASMALMDAGVPVTTPISGIAMGLIKEGDQTVILSDIQGLEDFLGDMDFKVTGNAEGVTALQMDIKIQGISIEIMKNALEQARVGRLHIMNKMAEAISTPRETLSDTAPRILSLKIPTDMIGTVIGPGGKNIRNIIETTGAQIDIEDDGLVTITSVGAGGEKAYEIVHGMTQTLEPGMVFKGTVTRVIPIGAFVEFAPGREGMVHISQIAFERINAVEDVLNVGDEVVVKIREIDDMKRVNLSIKSLTNEERVAHGLEEIEIPEGWVDEPPRPRNRDRGGRGGDRRGGGRDRGGRDRDRGGRGDRDRGDRGGRHHDNDGGGHHDHGDAE